MILLDYLTTMIPLCILQKTTLRRERLHGKLRKQLDSWTVHLKEISFTYVSCISVNLVLGHIRTIWQAHVRLIANAGKEWAVAMATMMPAKET